MGRAGVSRVDKPKTSGRRAKRVTLADVAARAGVSVATASVAITGKASGNCRVSPAVAEKIRVAARALKYRPNLQARNLSTQHTATVALIIKRSSWQNAMFYLTAAQRVLRERGYSEVFIIHPQDHAEFEREQLELCVGRRVEGIIIMPTIDLARRTNLDLINQIHQEDQIPVVQLGVGLPGCAAPNVMSDDIIGINAVVRQLCEMGHRRIAHVTIEGYQDAAPTNPFRLAFLRCQGYLAAMRKAGLAPQIFASPEHRISVPELYDRALALCDDIMAAKDRPTALVCFSDFTAAGLMRGLMDRGLSVPRDVSITGYDNHPLGRMLRPALTTLAPQYDRMGEFATHTLLDMIVGRAGQSLAVPPQLVMRESIAPVA